MHDWPGRLACPPALVVRGSCRIGRQGYRGIGSASCPTGPPHSLHCYGMRRNVLVPRALFRCWVEHLGPSVQCIYPAPRLMVPLETAKAVCFRSGDVQTTAQREEIEDAMGYILTVQANNNLVGDHLYPD